MATGDQIDRLRSRAAHYRREAGRARERHRRIYCRALAAHLEREAVELARTVGAAVASARQTELPPDGGE